MLINGQTGFLVAISMSVICDQTKYSLSISFVPLCCSILFSNINPNNTEKIPHYFSSQYQNKGHVWLPIKSRLHKKTNVRMEY